MYVEHCRVHLALLRALCQIHYSESAADKLRSKL